MAAPIVVAAIDQGSIELLEDLERVCGRTCALRVRTASGRRTVTRADGKDHPLVLDGQRSDDLGPGVRPWPFSGPARVDLDGPVRQLVDPDRPTTVLVGGAVRDPDRVTTVVLVSIAPVGLEPAKDQLGRLVRMYAAAPLATTLEGIRKAYNVLPSARIIRGVTGKGGAPLAMASSTNVSLTNTRPRASTEDVPAAGTTPGQLPAISLGSSGSRAKMPTSEAFGQVIDVVGQGGRAWPASSPGGAPGRWVVTPHLEQPCEPDEPARSGAQAVDRTLCADARHGRRAHRPAGHRIVPVPR